MILLRYTCFCMNSVECYFLKPRFNLVAVFLLLFFFAWREREMYSMTTVPLKSRSHHWFQSIAKAVTESWRAFPRGRFNQFPAECRHGQTAEDSGNSAEAWNGVRKPNKTFDDVVRPSAAIHAISFLTVFFFFLLAGSDICATCCKLRGCWNSGSLRWHLVPRSR